MFQILYTSEAKERLAQIAQQDPKSARIIFDHIKRLPQTYSADPFLKGEHFKGLKRNRVGRYRFIYRISEQEKEIHVITIDLRKSVYE
ncbi:MAG: type II toxin-antitoxin system RelE/ParE family toxin [Candidatus Omnitrophica bacterium]|nr:type II toxin-antitoxin system RelE/ParE family toxin [Candidatus Omnitrophota bacterium]